MPCLLSQESLLAELESAKSTIKSERERLEVAGEIDRVADMQAAEDVPAFDTLVGRWLELRWRYYTKDATGKRTAQYIWCEGEVVEVADGWTTKKTPKSQVQKPAAVGAVRIR